MVCIFLRTESGSITTSRIDQLWVLYCIMEIRLWKFMPFENHQSQSVFSCICLLWIISLCAFISFIYFSFFYPCCREGRVISMRSINAFATRLTFYVLGSYTCHGLLWIPQKSLSDYIRQNNLNYAHWDFKFVLKDYFPTQKFSWKCLFIYDTNSSRLRAHVEVLWNISLF